MPFIKIRNSRKEMLMFSASYLVLSQWSVIFFPLDQVAILIQDYVLKSAFHLQMKIRKISRDKHNTISIFSKVSACFYIFLFQGNYGFTCNCKK